MFVVQTSKLLFSFFLIFILTVTVGCGGRPESTTEAARSRPEAPVIPNNVSSAAQATQSQPGAQAGARAAGSGAGPMATNNSSTVAQATQPRPRVQSGGQTTATAAASIQHNVYLSWARSSSSVQGYYIYRALSAFGPFTRLNHSPEPATLYSDSTVLSGKVYFYTITSVNSNGESGYSNIIKAVIPSP